MRHEHLVVTVDSGTKARIEEDLDPGETVEAWVADAIDARLADEEARSGDGGPADGDETGAAEEVGSGDGVRSGDARSIVEMGSDDEVGSGDDSSMEDDDSDETDDGYDEGFEYVDDCSI